MNESLYEDHGGLYSPREPAMSPWNPRHQGGVPLAGLMTHLVEQAPASEPMLLTRITLDIIRPAPMAPLAGSSRIVRDGRRMQNIEAVLEWDGAPVVRATAVRVRLADTPASPMTGDYPAPEEAPDRPLVRRRPHGGGLETRIVEGGLLEPGPGLAWGRPVMDLLPGVAIPPTVGAAMVADIGSGVSSVLDSRLWSFANVDLAIHFARAPVSDWILVQARTLTAGNGVGLVESTLADRQGPFAKAHQTLFIAPQEAPVRTERRALA